MSQPLTLRIPIRNKNGDVVGEREVVSYAGLLSLAHANGLESIDTTIVQLPSEANGAVAVVRAVIVGRRGTYTGIGDADPSNVNRSVVRHLIRIAETRAKARAMRDMVSVGDVSIDELGGDDDDVDDSSGTSATTSESPRTASPDSGAAMTDAQRRVLFRLCARLGFEGREAGEFLAARVGIRDGRPPTRREASRMIDDLDAELRRGGRTHAA